MVVFMWWVHNNGYHFKMGVAGRSAPHHGHFWWGWVVAQKEEREEREEK
jgi:hypothetical protein